MARCGSRCRCTPRFSSAAPRNSATAWRQPLEQSAMATSVASGWVKGGVGPSLGWIRRPDRVIGAAEIDQIVGAAGSQHGHDAAEQHVMRANVDDIGDPAV